MKIRRLIEELEEMERRHGPEIEVRRYDCDFINPSIDRVEFVEGPIDGESKYVELS